MAFDNDDELLMNLGYKPELRRNFKPIEVFGIAFSIMSLIPSIASVFALSISGGGVGLTWGWLAPSIFILSVGISLAETGSAMPTSGGLYWWTYKFAPTKLKRSACWLAGYANTLGLIGGVCSIDHGCAEMILTIPALATDGSYVPSKYASYGVFVAVVFSHVAVGMITSKAMAKLQTFCIIINAVLIGVLLIALPVGLKLKGGALNSGSFVYGDTTNLYTGWPVGWSFFLSWMACIWTIGSFDSCIHMAEEASNAATAVPWGMVGAIGLCGLLGFLCNSVFAAVMNPDIAALAASSTGSPFTQMIYDCLNKKWAIAIEVLMTVVQWLMGLSILVATSRQTFAFSRDGALPFSRWVKKVNAENGVPYCALLFDATVAILIGLLVIINDAASNALFSLATSSNGLAWLSPIFWRAVNGKKPDFVPGPFYLGDTLSRVNSIIASLYLIFSIFFIAMFPETNPTDASSMNYTIVINFGVWLGALAYYFIDGHKWFEGPVHTLEGADTLEGLAPIDETLVRMPSKGDDTRSPSPAANKLEPVSTLAIAER